MELISILPDPIQFPSIYDFTFILFGNNGEIRIHVRLFEKEAVKHSKHDLANAKEPTLLARFRWYHRYFETTLLEEYYLLDFDQETVVLQRVLKDTEKEPDRVVIFTNGEKKFWLSFRKNESFNERFRFLTLDEAERCIAKEVYYNKKQVLFVHPEIIGKEV
jgi:DNA repair protein RadC